MYRKYREVQHPVKAQCNKCGRPATHPSEIGTQCNAPLPGGRRCRGMIRQVLSAFRGRGEQ